MPTLNWIGKDKVVNHHQDVPYRTLEQQYTYDNGKEREVGTSENKIIHGDNLEALKSLLPQYEGKINCIYIDPPYNTGNEKWVYNDNVNHPKLKKWLGQVVGKESEDLSRHDKWLCMMYPRLKLLHKLLAEDGAIFISIDDNEIFRLGLIMDEIFGVKRRLACIPVKAEPSGGKGKEALRTGHEYLLAYTKSNINRLRLETKNITGTLLNDKWGEYTKGRELSKWGSESLREDREEMWYPLKAPDGSTVLPIRNDGKEGRWRWGSKNPSIKQILKFPDAAHWEMRDYDEGIKVDGRTSRWFPYEKVREKEKQFGWNTWLDSIGFNSAGTKEIKDIFEDKVFDTPKPYGLVKWVVNLIEDKNGVILDSFAGSGTTAHAVIDQNIEDGGNRKYILVEMEEYADKITAERIKRVINGYGKGTNQVDGAGGAFTFYELGKPLFDDNQLLNEEVDMDKILEYVWYSETKSSYQRSGEDFLLGQEEDTAYYFYYTKEAITTLDMDFLRLIRTKAGQYIIYADNCLLDKKLLDKYHIIFKKIPRDISRF